MNEDSIKNKLPKGWFSVSLKEISKVIPGIGFPTTLQGKISGQYPFFKVGDISRNVRSGHRYLVTSEHYIDDEDLKKLRAHLLPANTVVFAKIGEALKLNRRAITSSVSLIDNNVVGVKGNEEVVNNLFLFFLLQTVQLEDYSRATTVPSVRKSDIEDISVPLPPLAEQHRIVAKIEELFSDLDAGIESLKTAQAQLKLYRQAVLKWAFEGKLTAEWRKEKQQKGELKSADELLAQIKTEREKRHKEQVKEWEAAVKAWEAGGKVGKKPTKPKTLKEVEPLSEEAIAELPELPEGWVWIHLGQLTWSVKDGPHYSPTYAEKGIPFITGGNVRPEGIDFKNVKYISSELHEELSARCKPSLGDILYTKGGTTGIARVNTYDFDFNVWVHVAVLKIVKGIVPFFVQYALNSPFCYDQSQKYTHGVGNQDLGLTRMVKMVLGICNADEQEQVVQEIESRLSICDQVETTITENLKRSEALRQSILKRAFEGKLVPQDPNDEPAERLLERIKQEKSSPRKSKQLELELPPKNKAHTRAKKNGQEIHP